MFVDQARTDDRFKVRSFCEKNSLMQRLPSLSALRVFDVAATSGSFVAAADSLHVTHGAVSRQIRALEEALGLQLFERRNRAVFLTPEGAQLHATTQQVFRQLGSTLAEITAPRRRAPLVVSCEPTLSMHWLIPRMGAFHAMHPDIHLHLSASGGPVQFDRDRIDVALRRNDFQWDGRLHVEPVGDEWIGPVCAPRLAPRNRLDLASQSSLHTATRRSAWDAWAEAAKRSVLARRSETFEHFYLSLQAAAAGLGVAIGSAYMVQADLANRRLVAPLGFVRDGSAYCLLSPVPFADDPRRAAFCAWVRDEFQASASALGL